VRATVWGMAPLPLLAAIAAFFPAVTVPESSFLLAVEHREQVRTMSLTCDPAGGAHPNAGQACQALTGVEGDISLMARDGVVCTLEYDPVTVTANGMWRGELRRFTARFSNPCVMRADTGPVFDF